MIANLRPAPMLLLIAAVLTVGACGGTAAAQPADDRSANTAAASVASAMPDSGTADEPADEPAAAGASDIVVTGAVELQMKKVGNCGMDALLPGTWEMGFDNTADGFEFYGDDLWILNVTIRGYTGAGTFETAEDSSGKAALYLTDMMGRGFDAQAGGSLTIDAGQNSGSVEVTLVDEEADETVTVAGTFTCEPY